MSNPTTSPSTRSDAITLVGVGVLIFKDGKILLGKRKNSQGAGTWSPPGGHLEYGETLAACAQREVLEETGLHILNIEKLSVTEEIFFHGSKHYVTIFMQAYITEGEPQVTEPDKCECWQWFGRDNLPEPLFNPFKNLLAQESIDHLFTR